MVQNNRAVEIELTSSDLREIQQAMVRTTLLGELYAASLRRLPVDWSPVTASPCQDQITAQNRGWKRSEEFWICPVVVIDQRRKKSGCPTWDARADGASYQRGSKRSFGPG